MLTNHSPVTSSCRLHIAATFTIAFSFAIILFWGTTRSPNYAFDDAFITYRYAENLRDGLGLRYNPDEWVLGTTTPLFTVILAGLGTVVTDTVALGHWMGVGGWLAASFLSFYFLYSEERNIAALLAPLLVAFTPILYASLGMETPFLVALMLAVACAWFKEKFWLTIGLAATLLLTRQDSALWLLILGLEVGRRRVTKRELSEEYTGDGRPHLSYVIQKLPWREGLATILITLPWWVFASWRYGSPFPNSAAAKIGQHSLMPVTGQPSFLASVWPALSDGQNIVSNLIILFILAFGLFFIFRKYHQFIWLIVWFIGYVLVYSLLGVVSFTWYFVPLIIVLHLLTAFSLGIMLGDEPSPQIRAKISSSSYNLVRLVVLASLLLILVNRGSRMVEVSQIQSYRTAYVSVGEWMADNTAPTDRIATIEIGVVGYLSKRPVLDTQGLVSPDMTTHQLGWSETLIYALNAQQPEYTLTLPDTAWDGVIDQWWFQAEYEPVAQFYEATIYKRRAETLATQSVNVPVTFATDLTLEGIDLGHQRLVPGEDFWLWLRLFVAQSQTHDYQLTVFLIDTQTLERHAITTIDPFNGLYRSSVWQPGDKLRIPFRLSIPDNLAAGTYRLGVLIYNPETGMGLSLADAPDQPGVEVTRGWLTVGEPTEADFPPPLALESPITWENGLTLTAIGWPATAVKPGTDIPIQFRWQTNEVQTRDLTLFVHLLNEEGEIVAQQDEKPGHGRWPTPGWQIGQQIHHTLTIALPETLPLGSYSFRIGWYDDAGSVPLSDVAQEFAIITDSITVVP